MNSETSPVYGFLKRPSMVDYPGKLAAVCFTSGCNFRCGFCHNAALLGEVKPGFDWEKLRKTCQNFRRQWVDGVVITGGEPTLAPNIMELVRFFKEQGFAVKLDTNGSKPEIVKTLLPYVDSIAMDVKCAPETYPLLTKFRKTDRVAESISIIRTKARDYEFRTTVIDDIHHLDEMRQIGELIKGARRYVLQPFIPRDDLLDEELRRKKRTAPDHLKKCAHLMQPYAADVVVKGV